MKTNFILSVLVLFAAECFSQASLKPPVIIVSTPEFIQGETEKNLMVHIDTNNDLLSDINFTSGSFGEFRHVYAPALATTITRVNVWVEGSGGAISQKVVSTLSTAVATLALVSDKATNPYLNVSPKGQVTSYKATIINTNFTVPVARFNFYDSDEENSEKARVAFFNSLGAGFGLSWGRIDEIADDEGNVLETKFKNTFGLHLGVLFSRDDNDNIVAPVITASVLDFQLGIGYELGKVEDNQKRPLVTLAYSIPLHKLLDTNFYIWRSSRPDREKTFSKSL